MTINATGRIRMMLSNELWEQKCIDLGDYKTYLNQIRYRVPNYHHGRTCQLGLLLIPFSIKKVKNKKNSFCTCSSAYSSFLPFYLCYPYMYFLSSVDQLLDAYLRFVSCFIGCCCHQMQTTSCWRYSVWQWSHLYVLVHLLQPINVSSLHGHIQLITKISVQ